MAKLNSTISTTTDSGNRYLYDRKKNSILLCNSILHHLVELNAQGIDIQEWRNGIDRFPVELEGCEPVSESETE